jgi:hypothetical protein
VNRLLTRARKLQAAGGASFGDEKERVRFFWQIFQGERPLEDYEQLPEGCRERDAMERMINLLRWGKQRELLGLKSHPVDVFTAYFQHKEAEGPHLEWEMFRAWWKSRQWELPDLDIDVWRELLADEAEGEAPAEDSPPSPQTEDPTERAALEARIAELVEQLGNQGTSERG